jgi:DNA-binding MarR family transcriptional regulator
MKLEDAVKQKTFRSESQKLRINITFTGSWVHAMAIKYLRPFGLTPQQFNILRILRGLHPNPVSGLAIKERMLDKMSNVSRLIEKLRVKGLIERQICPNDRRAMDVTITEKGQALLTRLDAVEAQWDGQFKTLNEKDQQTLNLLLDQLRG